MGKSPLGILLNWSCHPPHSSDHLLPTCTAPLAPAQETDKVLPGSIIYMANNLWKPQPFKRILLKTLDTLLVAFKSQYCHLTVLGKLL